MLFHAAQECGTGPQCQTRGTGGEGVKVRVRGAEGGEGLDYGWRLNALECCDMSQLWIGVTCF